ncbi:MAG: dTDP-Rha--alpha-D-GlcNAc-pyrophosphate polyprenol alpha-3-L-rhamnosyltransferase [Flavobacteriales bacterium]|nr:dTDP-Rha--alpha-D-GlcNAc-pyrophosphate polyprenol alpha-3-L-rhamnosyltransferase [Flavobacteriales bacterium]
METQKKLISIVLLNWNGKKLMQKFLPTLIKNSKGIDIYVVDNNSNDDSVKYLQENFNSIKIIHHKQNLGYAKGYNDAIKNIKTKYLVLINSDIETTKNWYQPIIDLMQKQIKIAACQPKVLDYNNKNYFEYAGASGGFIDLFGYPFCRGRIFNFLESDKSQYEDNKEVFWATGACLFIKKSSFDEVSGFDEDYFAHQEEIDLCWRLKNKGYKIMVCPKSVVYHVGGGTLEKSSSFKTYLNFRNNLLTLYKNLTRTELIWILPVRFILDGIAGISFLIRKNGFSHLIAVIKAHISFYSKLPKYFTKRKKIKQKANLTGRLKLIILLKFHLFRIRKFNDL